MDIMSMAGHVSLSELHNDVTVEGPFFQDWYDKDYHQSAIIWLKNGYGVHIAKGNNPAQADKNPADGDTAELTVMYRTETGCMEDYQNPVTGSSVVVSEIVDVLTELKGLSSESPHKEG